MARGASSAAIKLPSTGKRSSLPEKNRRRGWNQIGKLRVVDSTPSPMPYSPLRRQGVTPPTPVLPATTAAMRSSSAAAISAILPARELPVIAMRALVHLRHGQQVIDNGLQREGDLPHRSEVVLGIQGRDLAGCVDRARVRRSDPAGPWPGADRRVPRARGQRREGGTAVSSLPGVAVGDADAKHGLGFFRLFHLEGVYQLDIVQRPDALGEQLGSVTSIDNRL